MIHRDLDGQLLKILNRGKSVLLLGPRQTGKTTIAKTIEHDRYINLMDTVLRQRYEANMGLLTKEILALKKSLMRKPLIIIDEVQKIPNITDNIQILIDDDIANFIITGSSVRKIKNLLPGRVIKLQMYPLSINELIEYRDSSDLLGSLEYLLINGSLPGIVTLDQDIVIEQELTSYVSLYLEEEIRREALVRNLGAFNNFLRLACIESGNIVNLSKISQEIGVAHTTIAEYYQILIDCMVAEKIEPLVETVSKRRLTQSPKYIIFDLGIKRVAAGESNKPGIKQLPLLFEQFVGLELRKLISQYQYHKHFRLMFWRDHSGPEVDFVLESQGSFIPVEVKWTTTPSIKDARHLVQFTKEYTNTSIAYVVCRTPYAVELSEGIIAISWENLSTIFES